MSKSVSDLVIQYFQKYPKQDIVHGPAVDWVTKEYRKLYSKTPRDVWRAIRKLHQEGVLIKVKKGVYRYDPDYVHKIELWDFPSDVKQKIFEQDNYKCVVCGRGKADGVELCADHIKPKDKGGENSIENGQTLCMEHNLIKKNYSQVEAGKKYFTKIYKLAVTNGDKKMIEFCQKIFDLYDEYKMNGHIKRPDKI